MRDSARPNKWQIEKSPSQLGTQATCAAAAAAEPLAAQLTHCVARKFIVRLTPLYVYDTDSESERPVTGLESRVLGPSSYGICVSSKPSSASDNANFFRGAFCVAGKRKRSVFCHPWGNDYFYYQSHQCFATTSSLSKQLRPHVAAWFCRFGCVGEPWTFL